MNKILLACCLGSLSLFGAEFHSYEEALKLQKVNHKIIMIDVMRGDCHYCIKMEEEVFNDKEMYKWLQKRFILAEMNLDFDEVPTKFKVPFTPSFFFVNKQGKIVKKILGSWNIQDFKDLTKDIK
ncbi:thioredoxin family protein [Sulfurimonas sp.]